MKALSNCLQIKAASRPSHIHEQSLKYDGLTFYQASYFEAPKTPTALLSVNLDPGRPIKYLGSLLLVLGAIWHFYLRRKKTKNNSPSTAKTPEALTT